MMTAKLWLREEKHYYYWPNMSLVDMKSFLFILCVYQDSPLLDRICQWVFFRKLTGRKWSAFLYSMVWASMLCWSDRHSHSRVAGSPTVFFFFFLFLLYFIRNFFSVSIHLFFFLSFFYSVLPLLLLLIVFYVIWMYYEFVPFCLPSFSSFLQRPKLYFFASKNQIYLWTRVICKKAQCMSRAAFHSVCPQRRLEGGTLSYNGADDKGVCVNMVFVHLFINVFEL